MVKELPNISMNPAAVSASVPLTARLAHDIPKPKDWQAFQRNCVLLFRSELKDPNTQEYGRSGQNQGGIDVLGRRNGSPDHFVGVQCRLIAKPIKEANILSDCRAALRLKAYIKEIIFATTAPNDTRATDAAIAVERTLRAEGHDLTVAVYGWEALQTLIAVHDVAYNAFFPSVVATASPQILAEAPTAEFATQIAAQVVERMRDIGVVSPPREIGAAGSADEDPALHARIDTYRDLFKDQQQPLLAENGLLALLQNESLDAKPWALYRIETNLGAVALDLGREAEGARRFETACAVRPGDPKAIANLALARIIQGQFNEAMELARKALDGTPRADHAVTYLLQAAARSTWQGDPETLVPADLVGSTHADIGLAEFLRRRDIMGWAERCLELSRHHPDVPALKHIGAIAILELALKSASYITGGIGSVTHEELNRAADSMKAHAEHCLDICFADQRELLAYLNNAALLLRLCGRHTECEALLNRALPETVDKPQLRRLLALAQTSLGHREAALATLAGDMDIENQLLCAELTATKNIASAFQKALAVDQSGLDARLSKLRWDLVGDLALRNEDAENLRAAIAGLRDLDPEDMTAALLEIRGEQGAGRDDERSKQRLRALALALPTGADMATRYFLAEELRDQGLPEEAAQLLEEYVDLSRRSIASTLYLQSLAEARRDDAFRKAVAGAAPEVRDHPEILWTVAVSAWNVGDLAGAYHAIEALLQQQPDYPRARLLKIEILIRQDRSGELLDELDKSIEVLDWPRLQDLFRIAALLGHFGYVERAAALAYRLFLEHRDTSRAWMTLSILILEEGRGEEGKLGLWDAMIVKENTAVDLRYDDGEVLFFIVEPDEKSRKLDEESWEPEHPLAKIVWGLQVGDRFVGPNGREGTISQLRHKYVARVHYVMEHHETRFPAIFGFRRISVDVEQPGGLDQLIAELKARRDWIEQEEEQYRNGPLPIGVLAHRLGMDTIEVAAGLALQGVAIKVAIGNEQERKEAVQAIRWSANRGCVLDLLTYWTAWHMQALDVITATCGPIHLCQSVMDRLRTRREQIDHSTRDGLRSVGYTSGKLTINEVAPEVVAQWRDDVDRAIAWAEANATINPLVVGENLPDVLRKYLRTGQSDVIDSTVLAMQSSLLLVTDDLPTREFSRLVGGSNSGWLHQVFGVALDQRRIDLDTYIRWFAQLVDAGHSYLGVSAPVLARALRLDAEVDKAPGYLFRTLSKVIGGQSAEPMSHIVACLGCLRDLWSDPSTAQYRQPATGVLLLQLIRERHDDYGIILRTLLSQVRDMSGLVDYIYGWSRGHFIAEALGSSKSYS